MDKAEDNVIHFPVLTTEHLTLRQLVDGDAGDLVTLRSDPRVNQYLDRPESMTREEAGAFIKKIRGDLQNKWYYWVISLNKNQQFAGTICLWNFDEENQSIDIGYELLPGLQGRGLMREALSEVISFGFASLKVKLIFGYSHKDNERSKTLLLRSGFSHNAAMQLQLLQADQNSNEVVYSLKSPLL